MVIDKIGNINNIIEPKKTKSISSVKKDGKSDSIQISSEGKKAAETSRLNQIVKETPDIRTDRVREIKEKIKDGSYDFNNNKMLEMVADRIANLLLRR